MRRLKREQKFADGEDKGQKYDDVIIRLILRPHGDDEKERRDSRKVDPPEPLQSDRCLVEVGRNIRRFGKILCKQKTSDKVGQKVYYVNVREKEEDQTKDGNHSCAVLRF